MCDTKNGLLKSNADSRNLKLFLQIIKLFYRINTLTINRIIPVSTLIHGIPILKVYSSVILAVLWMEQVYSII